MFIYTAKLHRRRFLVGIVALVLACGLFAGLAGFHSLWGAQSTAAPTTTIGPKGIKTNEDRIAYLEQFGWTVTPDMISVEELQIPNALDDASLEDYLAIQTQQGFDLSDYAGKTVKRYTYAITNYPDGDTDIMASLMVSKKTVIGGEVFSTATGEILHGLARPA